MQETWVWSLDQEDPLEKGIATNSSILAWRIPQTKEPGGVQYMGSQRIGHGYSTNTFTENNIRTPVNLSPKFTEYQHIYTHIFVYIYIFVSNIFLRKMILLILVLLKYNRRLSALPTSFPLFARVKLSWRSHISLLYFFSLLQHMYIFLRIYACSIILYT